MSKTGVELKASNSKLSATLSKVHDNLASNILAHSGVDLPGLCSVEVGAFSFGVHSGATLIMEDCDVWGSKEMTGVEVR